MELNECHRLAIAKALYDAGFKPSWSSLEDFLLAGYGDLNFDFRYPLILDDNKVAEYNLHDIPHKDHLLEEFYKSIHRPKEEHVDLEDRAPSSSDSGSCEVSMKAVDNEFRTFIDVDGKTCKYMTVPIYSDGGFHINIMGVSRLAEAAHFASIIAHDRGIVCHSFNEGAYKK